jgi:tRNA G18 (ribose-2'-O)-methylase SpoU
MKRLFCFHKAKFLKLPLKQQHKKCAELLQAICKDGTELIGHYNELASWLDCMPLSTDKKEQLDRLHWHLQQSSTHLLEHSYCVNTLDRHIAAPYLPVTIYLDRLRSAHNIGSILRTVEAFRLGEVVFSEAMAEADHPQVQKCAMGTADWVTTKKNPWSSCPRPIIALETVKDAPAYYEVAFPDTFTLALGNEEYGLSDLLLQNADSFIQIPLYGRKNSLNVACAFAIVAGEIVKQKRIHS